MRIYGNLWESMEKVCVNESPKALKKLISMKTGRAQRFTKNCQYIKSKK